MTFINPQKNENDARTILKNCSWMRSLPQNALDDLLASSAWRTFARGEVLFHEGDKIIHGLLLESGRLEVFRYTTEGNEKIFGYIQNKEFLALPAVFMKHGRYPMSVRALEDGRALAVPKHAIHQMCLQYPEVTFQLLSNVCNHLYEMVNRVDWLTSSSTSERLAEYLLKLHKQNTEKKAITLPMNRVQLATYLGVRHETLIRLISAWQKKQYIHVDKNEVQILNPDVLRNLAKPAQRTF